MPTWKRWPVDLSDSAAQHYIEVSDNRRATRIMLGQFDAQLRLKDQSDNSVSGLDLDLSRGVLVPCDIAPGTYRIEVVGFDNTGASSTLTSTINLYFEESKVDGKQHQCA